jgi:hypothetical protein
MMELKRIISKIVIAIIILAVSLLYIRDCVTPKLMIRVIDASNNPVCNAYVIYTYTGTVFRGVEGLDEYHKAGSIIRTDKDGSCIIKSKIFFHWPVVVTRPRPEIIAIYDPNTHCAGKFEKYPDDRYDWFERRQINGIDTFIFHDVSQYPEQWYNSIKILQEVWRLSGVMGAWKSPLQKELDLFKHLAYEYEQFLEKYGDTEYYKSKKEVIAYDIETLFGGDRYKEATLKALIEKN